MPCRCDYMEPTAREAESKRVMDLLVEIGVLRKKPNMYGNIKRLDRHTEMLCDFCQENYVKDYSLELQMWWRDHQKADKERLTREQAQLENDAARDKALEKLTDYERQLLGV